MKTVVALSFSPTFGDDARAGLVNRARNVLERQASDPAIAPFNSETILVSGLDTHDVLHPETGRVAVLCCRSVATIDGTHVHPEALLERVHLQRWDDLAPPFGAVLRTSNDADTVAVTDSCGLRHLSWWQGEGVAAISSSARALAELAQADLDEQAVGTWAMGGFLFLDQTMWQGIRRLGPGQTASLSDGRLRVVESGAEADPQLYRTRAESVDAGLHVVREVISNMAAANPDFTLELSAGLDSRVILAAIPRAERGRFLTLTLSAPDGIDQAVATELAQEFGLKHVVVDRSPLADYEPEQAEALVLDAARRRDCFANPIAMGSVDWAEAKLPQRPRFTGQSAELAQGRYYPGLPGRALERMPSHGPVARRFLELLAQMSFFTNHRVEPALFVPGYLDDVRADMMRDVCDVGATGRHLAEATERVYLRLRMRGWAGAEYGVSALERHVLAPFFHPAYVRWAHACHPHDKQGASLSAELLTLLDPQLAARPINAGLTAYQLRRRDPAMSARRALRTARRLGRKADQRMRKREKPPAGTGELSARVLASWTSRPGALDILARVPVLNHDIITEIAEGSRSLSSGNVALLINLVAALELRDDARRADQQSAPNRRLGR